VYGIPQSTCTQRVLTTLIEKGLQYELKPVNIMNGEQKVC
jgi:glutathione S-transferase